MSTKQGSPLSVVDITALIHITFRCARPACNYLLADLWCLSDAPKQLILFVNTTHFRRFLFTP